MVPVPFAPGTFDPGTFDPGFPPGLDPDLAGFLVPDLAGAAAREGFEVADWAGPVLGRFWVRGCRGDWRAEVAPAVPSPDLTVWMDCVGVSSP